MSDWQITEEELQAANVLIQRSDDVLVHNCVTRTTQESKLFPILPYLDMTMIDTYWRYPDLLRKALTSVSPEDIGHRARNVSTTLTRLTAWASLNYYLNGRSLLMRLGVIGPEDNLEDLCFMVDWYRRMSASLHRNDGHLYALDAGDINHDHDERTLQVFEADAYACDEDLRRAAAKFMAVATQYNFLVHCESRSGLGSSGPYRLGERLLMHTRDFVNQGECGLPWLDGVADGVTYSNLTVVVITDGVAIDITDWGTPYTTPEDYQGGIVGVGLYASDFLADRYMPVGMDSPAELAETFDALAAELTAATRKLYSRFAEMSFDQMTEAGMQTYLRAPVDALMMAGEYRQSDWDYVDDRTRRLWPIFNEEYAYDAYVDNFAALTGSVGSSNDYYLHPILYGVWRRSGARDALPHPGRGAHLIPGHVLVDHDYPRRVNPNGLADSRGTSSLPAKTSTYSTSAGRLSEDELNAAAKSFASPLVESSWRHFDSYTIKYHHADPEVAAMYRYTQETSRLLRDRGSALLRADIDAIRGDAGERPWTALSAGALNEPAVP
jgi:hypothetical protein